MNLDQMTARLRGLGFVVGDRDPLMNTDFPGKYMVAHDYSEFGKGYTQAHGGDAESVWCIVGDDLAQLVTETHFMFTCDPQPELD